jgi:glyoxylase-like metal-dependent hydrolase (beta-lactamase superfamily II)
MQYRKHIETKKDDGKKTILPILTGRVSVAIAVGVLLLFYFSISNHIISTAIAQNVSTKQLTIIPTNSTNGNVIQRAIDAIGGMKSLQSIRTEFVNVDGQRYEPGQKFSPDEYPKYDSSYHYNATYDLASNSLHMNWQREVVYPYPQNLKYSIVIANNTGFINGKDGLFSLPKAPMQSSHVNALLKEQLITSPHLLLRIAVKHPILGVIQPDEQFEGRPHHIISLTTGKAPQPIKIFLDANTFLPSKVETIEDDPVYGDALVQVFFRDWHKVNGILFPFNVLQRIQGQVIEEKRSSIAVNVPSSSDNESFIIPPNMQTPVDPHDALIGWQDSQWFLRMEAFGLPHYNRVPPVNFTQLSPGIYHVTGDTHHSLVIDMKDYIIVVEAPLYQERSQAVIHEINKLWPGKPIRYIVQTHSHDDHIGGLRAYAADGAIVVTSEVNKDRVGQILNASHTIRPDMLQLHRRQVMTEYVSSQKKIISDGNKSVEIYPVKNSHADDMLAAYLPKEKILLDSDLYSPGGSPAPFKVYAKQLLDFITQSGIDVKTIAGTHGGYGPFTDLQKFVNQDKQMITSQAPTSSASSSNQTLSNQATLNMLGED